MSHTFIWIIAILSTAGVIIRPYRLPEAIWAVSGAIVLAVVKLIQPSEVITGIAKGTDVYFFLIGMMLLSETAREENLFDWLAAYAAKQAKGSAVKLFILIYLVGVLVTTFLSNDATAVVLTPAVAAAARAAKVSKPLPFLLVCAFIANAASFVLPISNPANLVIYGANMPPLKEWLLTYTIPSAVAIFVTFAVLYLTQLSSLRQKAESDILLPVLSKAGIVAGFGIIATAMVLITASAFNIQLGLPTAITGILTSAIVIITARKKPWIILKGVSWSVLPLVAGLFVIVEALSKTGLINTLNTALHQSAEHSDAAAVWSSGTIVAVACNLMNNLPAGLIAGGAVQNGHIPQIVKSAILIGVDLGPNLSITGSLATILWLAALRRENYTVTAWTFLKLGFLVMTPALLAALAALWL